MRARRTRRRRRMRRRAAHGSTAMCPARVSVRVISVRAHMRALAHSTQCGDQQRSKRAARPGAMGRPANVSVCVHVRVRVRMLVCLGVCVCVPADICDEQRGGVRATAGRTSETHWL